jgi:hypothetical protein
MWGHYYCPKNYRVLKGFTYNGQPKKEKSSVHRWKTKKKSKCETGWYCGTSSKKNFKHYTNRNHRAWQRRMLAHERYDEFHDRAWKRADNWWNWD